MKNILFALLLTLLPATALAEAPLMMAFQTTDGMVKTIDAESLSMTVTDGKLLASNGSESLEFALPDLAKMYFTGEAALTELLATADTAVSVYTADGKQVGNYVSAAKAVESLPAGIYIVAAATGKTFKISVR